eukprot:3622843-Pleurochrysis_carterae.AAC.1
MNKLVHIESGSVIRQTRINVDAVDQELDPLNERCGRVAGETRRGGGVFLTARLAVKRQTA